MKSLFDDFSPVTAGAIGPEGVSLCLCVSCFCCFPRWAKSLKPVCLLVCLSISPSVSLSDCPSVRLPVCCLARVSLAIRPVSMSVWSSGPIYLGSGKTKTPQMATLQVKIERGQTIHKKSAHSSRPCSCLSPAPKFPSTQKKN